MKNSALGARKYADRSPIPEARRYFSAFWATKRGVGASYGSLVIGSTMLQSSERVVSFMKRVPTLPCRCRGTTSMSAVVYGHPAADGGSVEAQALLETRPRSARPTGWWKCCQSPREVHELQIDHRDVLVLGVADHILGPLASLYFSWRSLAP